MLDLSAIKARAAAATPGPWRYDPHNTGRSFSSGVGVIGAGVHVETKSVEDWTQAQANAEFIANARQDIDDLCAEVERLGRGIEIAQAVAETAYSRDDIVRALDSLRAKPAPALSEVCTCGLGAGVRPAAHALWCDAFKPAPDRDAQP